MRGFNGSGIFGVLALGALAVSPAAAKVAAPHIDSVTLTRSHGLYTAVLTGTNFGAVPSGIPCDACSPLQLQVVDQSSQPHQETINVTDWSDTSVTVTGITADKADQLRIAVYNQTLGNVDVWGGPVKSNKGVPHIKSIVASGSGKTLTLTITGSGFGPAPDALGQFTDTPFFVFTDYNRFLPGTDGFPWNGGFCGTNDCNGVTADLVSWTDTEIVMSGFGDEYGNDWIANPQDAYCVGIWPGDSTSGGTTGGAYQCGRLPK